MTDPRYPFKTRRRVISWISSRLFQKLEKTDAKEVGYLFIRNRICPDRGVVKTATGNACQSFFGREKLQRVQIVLPPVTKNSGSLSRFHLMLQPILAFCSSASGRSASAAFRASLRSFPVSGFPLPGRLSSSCPR